MQKTMKSNNRARGRPAVDSEAFTVRLPRDLIKAIDNARRTSATIPTRPEVIRMVLDAWVKAGGKL